MRAALDSYMTCSPPPCSISGHAKTQVRSVLSCSSEHTSLEHGPIRALEYSELARDIEHKVLSKNHQNPCGHVSFAIDACIGFHGVAMHGKGIPSCDLMSARADLSRHMKMFFLGFKGHVSRSGLDKVLSEFSHRNAGPIRVSGNLLPRERGRKTANVWARTSGSCAPQVLSCRPPSRNPRYADCQRSYRAPSCVGYW